MNHDREGFIQLPKITANKNAMDENWIGVRLLSSLKHDLFFLGNDDETKVFLDSTIFSNIKGKDKTIAKGMGVFFPDDDAGYVALMVCKSKFFVSFSTQVFIELTKRGQVFVVSVKP